MLILILLFLFVCDHFLLLSIYTGIIKSNFCNAAAMAENTGICFCSGCLGVCVCFATSMQSLNIRQFNQTSYSTTSHHSEFWTALHLTQFRFSEVINDRHHHLHHHHHHPQHIETPNCTKPSNPMVTGENMKSNGSDVHTDTPSHH